MSEPMNQNLASARTEMDVAKRSSSRRVDISPLATQAIALMASRRAQNGELDETALAHLEAAVFDADRGRRIAVVDAMHAAGLSDVDIVDRYIPETARRLGEKWHTDEMSFADVTIGVARLQAMVREIAVEWERSVESDPTAPCVLVVVRETEHHMLGASVLSSQFRRLGVAVRVVLCVSDDDVLAEAQSGEYDMIAISASSRENHFALRNLVGSLKELAGGDLKIAIGGSILDAHEDLRNIVGADVATRDPAEALRTCGLRSSLPTAETPTAGRRAAKASQL